MAEAPILMRAQVHSMTYLVNVNELEQLSWEEEDQTLVLQFVTGNKLTFKGESAEALMRDLSKGFEYVPSRKN